MHIRKSDPKYRSTEKTECSVSTGHRTDTVVPSSKIKIEDEKI